MQLIAPDIFGEVGRLSTGACIIGFVAGLLIWLTGWWQHRFWVVASLTAAAGVLGLQSGRANGVQPLVAGLLAALAAGYLALELARVLAFVGGGAVSGLLVRTFLPTGYEPNYAYPLLVFFHGHGGNEEQVLRLSPRLSRRNYICIGLRGPFVLVFVHGE